MQRDKFEEVLVSVQVQVLVLCGAWKALCGSALGTAALKFLVFFVEGLVLSAT